MRAMPVQSAEDRVEHDPQLKARGMYAELDHPLLVDGGIGPRRDYVWG